MEDQLLADKIRHLDDLELALLSCLIADQHCLIETTQRRQASLADELKRVSSQVFGLSCSYIHCSASTTLAEFRKALLQPDDGRQHNYHPPSARNGHQGSPQLANNIITVTGLNESSREIQIQVLELMRTRSISTTSPKTHGAAAAAIPRRFVFVIVLAVENAGRPLVPHLVDHIFISHSQIPEWENEGGGDDDDKTGANERAQQDSNYESDSSSVVIKTIPSSPLPSSARVYPSTQGALISDEDIRKLAQDSQRATFNMEVRRYLQDIVVFLRLHRAVEGGMTPRATRQCEFLARCLASLHNSSTVTPSLVALAVRKVYKHRTVVVAEPARERSMQWGSELDAVAAALHGVTSEAVIDEVLSEVPVPL